MTNPEPDQSELTDQQIEDLYAQIQADDPEQSNAEVARAQAALAMIARCRQNSDPAISDKDTKRLQDTLPQDAERIAITEENLPKEIGRFQIKRLLGKGGFGIVLLAHDPNLGRDVALKIPRSESILTPDLKSRFVREGRAVATLTHPNIVPVYESGQIGSVCFMASHFVDGPTLAQLIDGQTEPFAPETVASVGATLADGISHAHQRNVLHRDLKPANLLIANKPQSKPISERIQITDFGLAKDVSDDLHQTQTGAMIGTPAYMSPEQALQQPAVPGSDIYSIGCILYELLTGKTPFLESNVLLTIQAIVKQEPIPIRRISPNVPKDLEAVCLKCLEKNPDDRYQSGFELRDDLNRFLEGRAVIARPISRLEYWRRWFARNPIVASLSTIAVILATSLIIGLTVAAILLSQLNEKANKHIELSQLSLVDSKISEARAIRLANLPNRKHHGLDLVNEASSIISEVKFNAQILANLKTEAAAALSLFDVEAEKAWAFHRGNKSHQVVCDNSATKYACRNSNGMVVAHSLIDNRLLKEISGFGLAHSAPKLSFSPDGSMIGIQGSYQEHPQEGYSPFSVSNNRLLADQKVLQIWKLSDAKTPVFQMKKHYRDEFQFLPKGSGFFQVSGTTNEVFFYDFEATSEPRRILLTHAARRFWISPDEKHLAYVATGEEHRLLIHDLENDIKVHDVKSKNALAIAGGWFADSSRFAYSNSSSESVDVLLRKNVSGIDGFEPTTSISRDSTATATAIHFSPDGNLCMMTMDDDNTSFWTNASDGHFQKACEVKGSGLGFSSDSKFCTFESRKSSIGRWRMSPAIGYQAIKDRSERITSIKFTDDTQNVISASGASKNEKVFVRNIQSPSEKITMPKPGSLVSTINGRIVTLVPYQQARFWEKTISGIDLASYTEVEGNNPRLPRRSVDFSVSGDGGTISFTSSKGLVFYDLNSGTQTAKKIFGSSARHSLNDDGSQVATTDHRSSQLTVNISEVSSLRVLKRIAFEHTTTEPAFSPDGNWLALKSNADCSIFDTRNWNKVWSCDLDRLDSRCLAFSPDSSLVAITSVGSIAIFETATGQEVFSLTPSGEGSPTSLDFSNDGKLLAAGDTAGIIHVWDLQRINDEFETIGVPVSVSNN